MIVMMQSGRVRLGNWRMQLVLGVPLPVGND